MNKINLTDTFNFDFAKYGNIYLVENPNCMVSMEFVNNYINKLVEDSYKKGYKEAVDEQNRAYTNVKRNEKAI